MPDPPPETRPTRGNHQDNERERYRHARDVEYVAKSVVGRRRFWGCWLLSVCDEHQTSGLSFRMTRLECDLETNLRVRHFAVNE